MLSLIKKIYSKINSAPATEEKFYINVSYSEKDQAKELGLPENHQTKEYEDEDDEGNDRIIWKTENYKSIVSFVSFANKKSIEILQKFSSHYYFDFSKQSSGSYYMNHCKSCNSKLGDFYMHSEPSGAFQPMTSEEAGAIKLYWFNEVFEASIGTYSIDVDYFDHMKIISK